MRNELKNYLRFFNALTEIQSRFPEMVVFDPRPLAPVTFACRLRDAMADLLKNRWNQQLAEWYLTNRSRLQVQEQRDGSVKVEVRPEKAKPSAVGKPLGKTELKMEWHGGATGQLSLDSFAYLINEGLLPACVAVSYDSPEHKDHILKILANYKNVGVVVVETENTIIIT